MKQLIIDEKVLRILCVFVEKGLPIVSTVIEYIYK